MNETEKQKEIDKIIKMFEEKDLYARNESVQDGHYLWEDFYGD